MFDDSSLSVPRDVLPLFEKAGWFPNRKIDLLSEVIEILPVGHPVIEVLSQFGGLHIGETGAGEECARGDIHFLALPHFNTSRLELWNRLLDSELVLIAETHNGDSELYIDSTGRCFGSSRIHDAFYFEGKTLVEAMQRILLGKRASPMLRPDQKSVMLYGRCFNASSPEVYQYE